MWYTARLLFECKVDCCEKRRPLYDESFILVEAESGPLAETLALAYADGMAIAYTNDRGETVTWRFIALLDLFSTSEDRITSGMEVYSETSGHLE